MKPGSVSIVGAGPGDPELITLKALRRIQEADVILYDRLANKELLKYAKEGAMLTYCGKAPGLSMRYRRSKSMNCSQRMR